MSILENIRTQKNRTAKNTQSAHNRDNQRNRTRDKPARTGYVELTEAIGDGAGQEEPQQ